MHSHIDDLLVPALLARYLDDGYIREQTRLTLPLRIFNYAEKAVFEREWNEVAWQCRGLVIDHQGRILARRRRAVRRGGAHVLDRRDQNMGLCVPLKAIFKKEFGQWLSTSARVSTRRSTA
ncbi:hypothetical protein JK364_23730 [Streptomyces sp. 110]|uniref:Uncharacterized protein n=1 Tax=Streptomyces endocoffeicus TaxID=2898945 RepID=A0ABS1PSH3_9ACTN|nr:hypothetical protein [Streptomyces endocoffeicus]MBL1115385.1 hypothetical protein [Streptomyces endocoffeicus]